MNNSNALTGTAPSRIAPASAKRLRPSPLALLGFTIAVALGILSPSATALARPALIFGDSAADQGNLHATPGYEPAPAAPYHRGPDGLLRLSDGPLWTERLFPALRSINTPGPLGQSVNFAYGGATTGTDTFGLGPAGELPVGVENQVAAYLALRASGDLPTPTADTLAFIEAGPNDYFAALATGENLSDTAAASPARLAASARQLASAGIRTVFVTETPDFGEAPLFHDLGLSAEDRAALRDVAASSRHTLRRELASLQASLGASHRIVVLPLNALFTAIQKNPAAFGFTNLTGKIYDDTTATLLETDSSRRDGYLFVDSLHLTSRAQSWQARYYSEVIGAIDGTHQRRFARVTDALAGSAHLAAGLTDSALAFPATHSGWTPVIVARGSSADSDFATADGPDFRSHALGSLLGAHRLLSPNWLFGVGLATISEKGKTHGAPLRWENASHGLWLFNRWQLQPVTVRLSLGAAHTDTELTRDTGIPTFKPRAETDGTLLQARFEVSRPLLRLTPAIGSELLLRTDFVRSSLDGFTETGAPGLALAVDKITRDSLRSEAGLRFRADPFRLGRVTLEPLAEFILSHEGGDRHTRVTAQLIDNSALPVANDAPNGPRTTGTVRFSCGIVLTKNLRSEIADTLEIGSSGRDDHRVELGLGARF